MEEHTFVMVKPDAVRRGLVGEVLSRFERVGFQMVFAKLVVPSEEEAEKLYSVHKDKPFFQRLVEFTTSGRALILIFERDNAVTEARKVIGAEGRLPGTIRGDYATGITENLVHTSDSLDNARKEASVFIGDFVGIFWPICS